MSSPTPGTQINELGIRIRIENSKDEILKCQIRDFWPRQYINGNQTLLLSQVFNDLTLKMEDPDVERKIIVIEKLKNHVDIKFYSSRIKCSAWCHILISATSLTSSSLLPLWPLATIQRLSRRNYTREAVSRDRGKIWNFDLRSILSSSDPFISKLDVCP